MTSNHLDRLCLEVAGSVCVCVCVIEVRMHFFNTFVSSAKAFISSTKRVRLEHQNVCLQHKMRSLLVINRFVCSVISYLEMSSRDYLVTSEERVCLQCDTAFGGE